MSSTGSASTGDLKQQQTCPCMEVCPISTALAMIGGKWKLQILCALIGDGPCRYSDLKRKVSGITNTMLASSLKELEQDDLIVRTQFNQMPLRVEYAVTDSSKSLMPIIGELLQWTMKR